MPKLPTYNNAAVERTAIPSVRELTLVGAPHVSANAATAAAFGGIQAREMQDAGRNMMSAGGRILDAATEDAKIVAEADVKQQDINLADSYRTILHDPDTGILNLKGKAALEARDIAVKSIDELNRTTAESLKTDYQRRMFAPVAAQRRNSALQQIDTHASFEARVYGVGQAEARAEAQMADFVTNWTSNGMAEGPQTGAKLIAFSEIAAAGRLAGKSPEEVAQKQLAWTTEGHATIIGKMIAEDKGSLAKEYFKKNATEIHPKVQDNLLQSINRAGEKEEGTNLYLSLKGSGKGEAAQLSEIDQQYKEKKISQTSWQTAKAFVEHDFAKRRQAANEYEADTIGKAQTWVLNNPGVPLQKMPPNLYAVAEKKGAIASLESFSQREGRPADRNKELEVRGQMLIQMHEDREGFLAEFRRTGFRDKMDLGAAGIKEMQTMASNIMQGKDSVSTFKIDSKILADAMPDSLKNSKSPKAKSERATFEGIQYEELAKWKKAHPGKLPTIEEQKGIAAAGAAEWVQIGSFMNTNRKVYELTPEMKAVPKDFYNSLKAKKATDDEIVAAWKLKQARDKK